MCLETAFLTGKSGGWLRAPKVRSALGTAGLAVDRF